jgi:hypothetical protein
VAAMLLASSYSSNLLWLFVVCNILCTCLLLQCCETKGVFGGRCCCDFFVIVEVFLERWKDALVKVLEFVKDFILMWSNCQVVYKCWMYIIRLLMGPWCIESGGGMFRFFLLVVFSGHQDSSFVANLVCVPFMFLNFVF